MTSDAEHGRSPDGSGHSAEPEPSSTVSAVPVSVPNAVIAPFLDALADFEGECLFGCLGSSEAGVWYPDDTRFALVHIAERRMYLSGPQTMDDAPEDEGGDIGSFTLGDLRKLKAAALGKSDTPNVSGLSHTGVDRG